MKKLLKISFVVAMVLFQGVAQGALPELQADNLLVNSQNTANLLGSADNLNSGFSSVVTNATQSNTADLTQTSDNLNSGFSTAVTGDSSTQTGISTTDVVNGSDVVDVSAGYPGTLVQGADYRPLPPSFYEGQVIQQIPHASLPLKILVLDRQGETFLVVENTITGQKYRLAKDIGVNLVNASWEGSSTVITEKGYLDIRKLPMVYARTADSRNPSRLVAIPLYDGRMETKEVDAGLIEVAGKYVFVTPERKHVSQYFVRPDLSHEIYALIDGQIVGLDVSEAQGIEGQLDLDKVGVNPITDPEKKIKDITLQSEPSKLWVVGVMDERYTENSYSQLFLYEKLGLYSKYVERKKVFTTSAYDKMQPQIHIGEGLVTYFVKDELHDLLRIVVHVEAEKDLSSTNKSCSEYFVTSHREELETEALSNNYVLPSWADPISEKLVVKARRLYQSCGGAIENINRSVAHNLNFSVGFKDAVLNDVCAIGSDEISERVVDMVQPVLVADLDSAFTDCTASSSGLNLAAVSCPEGTIWDEKNQVCASDLVVQACPEGSVALLDGRCIAQENVCSEGYKFDVKNHVCVPVTITCPDGTEWNPDSRTCDSVVHVVEVCPSGSKRNLATGLCEYPAICPQGSVFDEVAKACVQEITVRDCPEGSRLDLTGTQCVHEVVVADCPEGSQLDKDLNQCVFGVAECPDGSSLNLASARCEFEVRMQDCPEGSTYDLKNHICVLPVVCPEGASLNLASQECVYKTSVMDCPEGSELNLKTNQCVYPVLDCPQGSALNESTLQCEYGVLACPEGSQMSLTGACVVLDKPQECVEGVKSLAQVQHCDRVDTVDQLDATCPQGTYASFGECITPITEVFQVLSKDNENKTTISYSHFEMPVNDGASVKECPEGYVRDEEKNLCYQLVGDQEGLIEVKEQEAPNSVAVGINSGDEPAEGQNSPLQMVSGGFSTEGGFFGCSLNEHSAKPQSSLMVMVIMGLLGMVLGVWRVAKNGD